MDKNINEQHHLTKSSFIYYAKATPNDRRGLININK